jgi:hypothetical protein
MDLGAVSAVNMVVWKGPIPADEKSAAGGDVEEDFVATSPRVLDLLHKMKRHLQI